MNEPKIHILQEHMHSKCNGMIVDGKREMCVGNRDR